MSKITNEDLRMVEELHNLGFTDKEIGASIGRSEKSAGQIIFHHKDKMNLIDRVQAKRIRKAHEKATVERVMEAKKVKRKPRKKVASAPVPAPKQSLWDRMIGFFG